MIPFKSVENLLSAFLLLCFLFRVPASGAFSLVAARPQHPSAGPSALHPSPKFEISASRFFRHLPGKGQTEWFALCTPCSFFPDATMFRRQG